FSSLQRPHPGDRDADQRQPGQIQQARGVIRLRHRTPGDVVIGRSLDDQIAAAVICSQSQDNLIVIANRKACIDSPQLALKFLVRAQGGETPSAYLCGDCQVAVSIGVEASRSSEMKTDELRISTSLHHKTETQI